MKISELRERLDEIENEYGDIDVATNAYDGTGLTYHVMHYVAPHHIKPGEFALFINEDW